MNGLLTQETINGVNVLFYCTAGIGIAFTVVCGWVCPYMARRYTSFLLDKELLDYQVDTATKRGCSNQTNTEKRKELIYNRVINELLDEVDFSKVIYSNISHKGNSNKFSSKPRGYKHNLNKLNNNNKFNDWEGVYIQ